MKWITESMKRSRKLKDRYSMRGTEIYINDPVGEHINLDFVFEYITARVPKKLLDSVDVIYVGDFPEFEKRDINAFYDSGAIFVTNQQDDDQDMIDDIVHEIAHAVEERYNDFVYSDSSIEREFMAKRETLYRLLETYDLRPPQELVVNSAYNQLIDDYLYEEVGYDILNDIVNGLFISAYAATSVSEYYARGFEEWVFGHRQEIKKLSPALYNIFDELFEEEK
jgi:hypothetical protein